jgi:hypothetical protein
LGDGEAKLVRCASGAVLDVLNDQVCTQVYNPRGFHGFAHWPESPMLFTGSMTSTLPTVI